MEDLLKTTLEEMISAQVGEVENLVDRWMRARGTANPGNLAILEVAMREWALKVGRTVFERLLTTIAQRTPQVPPMCTKCGASMYREGTRTAKVHTSMGDVKYEREYARCRACGIGAHVLDEEFGLDKQHNSPALQKMVSLAGTVGPFEKASELLSEIGSVLISARKVERITEQVGEWAQEWMNSRQQGAMSGLEVAKPTTIARLYVEADGTTVPMRAEGERRAESQRTEGKVEYKEVKIGAIFEATVDKDGQPHAKEKTYTGTFEDADVCVRQVVSEAKAIGSDFAKEIVTLMDGSAWLWNRLPLAFPGKKVTQILDWCHPSERLSQVGRLVFGEGTSKAGEWAENQRSRLYEGQVSEVIASLECLKASRKEAREFVRQSLDYFREHAHRMNYAELRASGYFIGSGVIESGCKHIVANRLKQAGMKWSRKHVSKLLALRICRANGWWERFWNDRVRKKVA